MKVVPATGPLLERSEELRRIESALDEARSGRGRFVVIEGPAGIGKRALLTAARTAAADGGKRVLRSRGTELEGSPAEVQIVHPEAANDKLTINGLGGDDDVTIGGGVAALIQTLVDLGADE